MLTSIFNFIIYFHHSIKINNTRENEKKIKLQSKLNNDWFLDTNFNNKKILNNKQNLKGGKIARNVAANPTTRRAYSLQV